MKNPAFEQGGHGPQVVLYELDSEFNLVLGLGRDTKFEYMVMSLEEIKNGGWETRGIYTATSREWLQVHMNKCVQGLVLY